MKRSFRCPAALAALLLCAAAPARSHDTWFEREPATPAGQLVFSIGTGNRFPVREFPVGYEHLIASGCRGGGADAAALAHVEDRPAALVVRSAGAIDAEAGASCWALLKAFDVEVPADKVELYLREIQAGPALRASWAAMKSRGLPWRERYTKSSRIEVGGQGLRPALPMPMDIRIDTPRRPLRAGDEIGFQVLRNGAPLADQPIEIVNHQSPLGIWRRTDAQGRVRIALPLAGRWLLRGVDLRVSSRSPDEWDSDFVSLALEVAPREGAARP